MMTYNYDTQKWEDNRELRIKQLKQELNLLKSPQGQDYANYINTDRFEAIKLIEKRIENLKQ